MHELSIAMEILDIVEAEANKNGASEVKTVRVKIGDISGVEPESLRFCFESIRGEKEITRQADLVIDRIPVRIRCGPCGKEFEGGGHFMVCPECDGHRTEMMAGDELSVAEIEID